jgi:hypothetical protein
MFDWLAREIAEIKTNKFHKIDGPISPENRALVERSVLAVPPSYKQFVVRFGNANLYRSSSGVYLVRVFAVPSEEEKDGEALHYFGRTDKSLAYFKDSLLAPESESPVFESYHNVGLRKTADGFEEWLQKKSTAARRAFKKQDWESIVQGPPPFDDRERAIIEARRQFRCRVVGVTGAGEIQFEVINESSAILPFLSVSIRGKSRVDGSLFEGEIAIPTDHILPRAKSVVVRDCGKEWIDAKEIEANVEPDPGPEDRKFYWEFRASSKPASSQG